MTRKNDSEVTDIYLLHKLPDEDFALESNVSTYLQFPSEPITKKLLRCCRLANLAAPATWEVKVRGFKGIKWQRDDFMNSYLPGGVCLLLLFTASNSFRKEKWSTKEMPIISNNEQFTCLFHVGLPRLQVCVNGYFWNFQMKTKPNYNTILRAVHI